MSSKPSIPVGSFWTCIRAVPGVLLGRLGFFMKQEKED
jgi:hypothetical protein